MKGTYQKIKEAMSKRENLTRGIIDLHDQLSTTFFYCQRYWTLLYKYNQLKIIQNNLSPIIPSLSNYDEEELGMLDYLYILELWKHYKKTHVNTKFQDDDTTGVYSFFDDYLGKNWTGTKKELEKLKLTNELMENLDQCKKIIYEPLYINKINLEKKNQYVFLLKETLQMPKRDVEESVDAILTPNIEKRIIFLLEQNNVDSDVTLYALLICIISDLTWGNIRYSIEKDSNTNIPIFTDKCTVSFLPLYDAVIRILMKYCLTTDLDKIEKIKKKVVPLNERYSDQAVTTRQKLYDALVICCFNWIKKYEETWQKTIKTPEYIELKTKLSEDCQPKRPPVPY